MLYASFVRPEGIYDSALNHLAAWVTRGPFCHCEFIFSWSPEELRQVLGRIKGCASLRQHQGDAHVCIYTIWGDSVKFRKLEESPLHPFFQMPTKDLVKVPMGWDTELNLFTWCMNQMGAKYDKIGALLSPIQWRKKNAAYERYFCSQLMTCGLQRVGFLEHHNPGGVTPNSLYDALRRL